MNIDPPKSNSCAITWRELRKQVLNEMDNTWLIENPITQI
jgi:hypothetical protein